MTFLEPYCNRDDLTGYDGRFGKSEDASECGEKHSVCGQTAVLSEAQRQGIYLMSKEQAGALARLLFKPTGGLNPQIVGKSAIYLAEKAGFSVPRTTKVLMAREQEAGFAEK